MHQRDDERRDVAIALILAFAMAAGVWLYATKAWQGWAPGAASVGAAVVPEPAPAVVMAGPVSAKPGAVGVPAAATPVAAEAAPSWFGFGRKERAASSAPTAVVAAPPAAAQAAKAIEAPAIQASAPPMQEPPVALVVPPPPPPPDEPAPQPRVVVSESFEFATGSAAVPASAMARLDQIAELLRNDPRALTIAGHTDNIGDPADNAELSRRRAEAVMRYLVSRGVPAAQLAAKGRGQDQPIADNATAEGRARNRRIEITE